MKALSFLLAGDKRNCIGSTSVSKIVTALFRAHANREAQSYRASVAGIELPSLNSLEFVSPEPHCWSQSLWILFYSDEQIGCQRISKQCIYICVVLLQCVHRRIFKLAQCQWKSCVKNSKAASPTFTLTVVTAWNGKYFDPCWKKAKERVKGGCFIMLGGHSCYSTLWMTVIKLTSWRGTEISCDLVLIILNSLEMRLGDFCH